MTDAHISLQNVSVSFSVDNLSVSSLKSRISNFFGESYAHVDIVNALKDINLNIGTGERVGLIGANGAGKSTLLKVISGIYKPLAGTATINGHVSPMFELATGFEMEMSGWENIKVRGLLLGMSLQEIESKSNEIAEFSGLGRFLDYPVKTYSSGMFIRLAFSIATSINPEILLLDEIIGAGDLAFSKKSAIRLEKLIEQGNIIIMTSHSMGHIRKFCDRVIWLEQGVIAADDDSESVIKRYEESIQ